MRSKKNLKWLLLILIVTIIMLCQLFYRTRLYGHDTLFHVGNIMVLSKTISFRNIFGSNIVKLDSNIFGYGTWLFYPKLSHLLGSYFYLICNNAYLSMNIVYFIVTFLSGVVVFYLAYRIFKCYKVSFLSSVIYLTFSYHLCEIYTRDAFAENFMFLVIPLIFLGLWELKEDNYSKFYIFFISGYVLGMYSHLVSMVFCTIFVILFLVYYRKYFFTSKKIKKLFISAIIVTCLVLPFLTTILEHKLMGDYIVFTDNFSNRDSTILNILPLESYFNHDKQYNFNNILVYFNYSMIFFFVVTMVMSFMKKNRGKYLEEKKLLLFSILILIAFLNSKWLWENIPDLFTMIQFPWRLMTFLCLVLSLYTSMFILYIDFNKYKFLKNLIYVAIVVIMLVEGINNIYYYGESIYSYKEVKESRGSMGWQLEYLPIRVVDRWSSYYGEFLDTREYNIISSNCDSFVIKNNNKYLGVNTKRNIDENSCVISKSYTKILDEDFPNMKFRVSNINDVTYIEMPRIYYLGYQLFDKDGKKIELYETNNGFIGARITESGIYTLKYTGTIYDKISRLIQCAMIIIIAIIGSKYIKTIIIKKKTGH